MTVYFQKTSININSIPQHNGIGLSEYEKTVFNFCKFWLRNASGMEVQTSGSTGLPKVITLSRNAIEASVAATAEALNLNASDVAFLCLDIAYIAGKMMAIRAIDLGMDLIVVPPSSYPLPSKYSHKINFAAFVPLQLQTLLQSKEGFDFVSGIKKVMVGGGPISLVLHEHIQLLPGQVYHSYGMTETTTHIALKKLNGPMATGWYRTLPAIQIEMDARSCLMIKGTVTNDEWIITNDLVELHDKENFSWLGRADNVINSGGIKVSPEVIEEVIAVMLNKIGVDKRFFVGPIANKKFGQEICLFIEGSEWSQSLEHQLLKLLANHLEKYTSPKSIRYIDNFVFTNNKIQRHATLQKFIALKPN